MPSIVQHLIPENQTPETLVTVTEEMIVQDALERMIEHDFSQLPVVDKEFKLRGLITSDSILRAVSYFKSTVDKIKVSHATFKAKTCRPDDDLTELLNGLRDSSAISIVDKAGKLLAIVTNYDTAEYYRQRAEDIMSAEDIETTLRDYIELFYRDSNGNVDNDVLRKAIEEITPSGKDLRKKFKQALCGYLGHLGVGQDNQLIDDMFNQYLYQPIEVKSFEALTLFEYIQLFKNIWENYKVAFNHLEWEAIYKLLNEVRQTRNAIAHFRELTPNQRKQLKFCASLLERHPPLFQEAYVQNDIVAEIVVEISEPLIKTETSSEVQSVTTNPEGIFSPTDEEIGPNESRYTPLALWLQNQIKEESEKIVITFEQIETIISDKLPPSARQHRTWWGNDAVSHTQSQQWLDVGWRVSSVNMSKEQVVFSQIDDRQSAYIEFFNTLLPKLQTVNKITVQAVTNPQGRHWFTTKITSDAVPEPVWITFSFARRSRFRIELYIETGDRDRNKQLFDKMYAQKTDIEAALGDLLKWERLDNKQGSRIALYREGASITGSLEELINLQNYTVVMMSSFYWALAKRFWEAQQTSVAVVPRVE